MNAIELMEEVAKQGLKVAGMSATEAANALGFTQLANGMFVKNIINSTAGKVLEFPTSTAAEAIAEAGASATKAASSTTANLTLVETASGTTSTAGILSIAAPVAASLLAAVGGYLVGNKLYEAYPDFFDKLTGPLMKYLADGTVNLMGLMDSNGNTYLNKGAYDDLKNYLDNIGDVLVPNNWSGSVPLNSLKPTCSLESVALKTLKDGVANGSWAPALPLDEVTLMLKLVSNWVSSNFPNSICTIYPSNSSNDTTIEAHVSTNYTADGTIKTSPYYGKFIGVAGTIIPMQFSICDTNMNLQTPISFSYGGKTQYLYNNHIKADGTYYSQGCGINDGWLPLNPFSYGGLTTLYACNFSYTSKSGLPSEITKYTPKTSTLTNLLLHTTVDGCPVEVPYIPVRFPNNPTIIPFPDPNVNPSENDPNDDPKRINPCITPNPAYPDNVPNITPNPEPSNPDKKPVTLPDPTPDKNTTTDTDPDPDKDPSQDTATDPDTKTPVDDDGTTNPDDGGSTPDPTPPIIPPISSSATGLLHVYNPTVDQLNQFGSWLWTTFSGDLIDTLAKLFNNPMDAVIGLHELYSTPICQGNTSSIKAGFLDSGVTSKMVTTRYTSINCGSLVIPEHWGNYLDYTPYTKVYCYLPFIGIVELNADDIIAHGVNITYRIDSYTGACIAIITVAKDNYNSATYQFSGNCAVEIPITSGVKSTMQNALIGAATAGIMATAGAGVTLASVGASALRGGASRAINSKNEVQHSGSFGSSFGAMGFKKPYLIVKRPRQKVVAGYNENYGYPAHKMAAISECSGYLRAREVDVISVTATEDEKKLIETALKSGVFVS